MDYLTKQHGKGMCVIHVHHSFEFLRIDYTWIISTSGKSTSVKSLLCGTIWFIMSVESPVSLLLPCKEVFMVKLTPNFYYHNADPAFYSIKIRWLLKGNENASNVHVIPFWCWIVSCFLITGIMPWGTSSWQCSHHVIVIEDSLFR